LSEILDRKGYARGAPVFISTHADRVAEIESGYGSAKKPEDYIAEFRTFIQTNGNRIPALTAVLTRPRDLTRKQLRELLLALDQAGFHREKFGSRLAGDDESGHRRSNLGLHSQAALGDALVSYDERVNRALQGILSSRAWTTQQRTWLTRIAEQTKANLLVDRGARWTSRI